MKKVGVVFAIALFAFSMAFTSCKKSYTCTDCTDGETKEIKARDDTQAAIDCLAKGCLNYY